MSLEINPGIKTCGNLLTLSAFTAFHLVLPVPKNKGIKSKLRTAYPLFRRTLFDYCVSVGALITSTPLCPSVAFAQRPEGNTRSVLYCRVQIITRVLSLSYYILRVISKLLFAE